MASSCLYLIYEMSVFYMVNCSNIH